MSNYLLAFFSYNYALTNDIEYTEKNRRIKEDSLKLLFKKYGDYYCQRKIVSILETYLDHHLSDFL
jgi:hypothetical protein